MRVRGLKQGAHPLVTLENVSHPMRVRGLKQNRGFDKKVRAASHPMRVRGLKPEYDKLGLDTIVAPHAGAWIETNAVENHLKPVESHPMRVRGLKLDPIRQSDRKICRTPCGCVD